MSGFWKRFGWFWMTLLPVAACIVLQFWMSFQLVLAGVFYLEVRTGFTGVTSIQEEMIRQAQDGVIPSQEEMTRQAQDIVAPLQEELESQIQDIAVDISALGLVAYHIIGIVLFGIWYYFGSNKSKKQRQKSAKKLNVRHVGLAAVLGVTLCAFNIQLIEVAYYFVPKVIDEYSQTMELWNQSIFYVMIAAVFLAPVGEELLCRGVVQHYAGKVSRRFWVVNIVQALAFGVMHLNLIQGSYAFCIGLVLGWLRYRYDSLLIPMVIHFVVNFSSFFWLNEVLVMAPDYLSVDAALLLMAIGLTAGGLLLFEKLCPPVTVSNRYAGEKGR